MNLEFSSLKDLYLRVEPALSAKKRELDRIGLSHVQKVDIWNYLIESKWKKSKGLMLSDIVDDILNTDCSLIENYLKEKIKNQKRNASLNENIDII
ncbi:MAG: hypothetical protein IJ097_02855 [Bacilli bacterium]|nr:hypothetical protein [Bacilli bacterium]